MALNVRTSSFPASLAATANDSAGTPHEVFQFAIHDIGLEPSRRRIQDQFNVILFLAEHNRCAVMRRFVFMVVLTRLLRGVRWLAFAARK